MDQGFKQDRSFKMTNKNFEMYNQLYPSSPAAEKPVSDEHNQQQLNAINN